MGWRIALAATSTLAALAFVPLATSANADPHGPSGTELSETTRLADRRSVTIGDRFYQMSTADGLYPGAGWHIRAEMGGFWTPPVKLLDGVWFGLDGSWLGKQVKAERYTAGYGYTKIRYASASGVRVERTDVAPDGIRAGLIGLTLSADQARTVKLDLDAHSELMPAYPWGWTTPNTTVYNLPDTGRYEDGALVFRETGTPDVENAPRHDFAAMVAANRTPVSHTLGDGFRGPQEPPVICPAEGEAPQRCDDSAFGKGTGGRLTYELKVPAGKPVTLWVAVSGSDKGIKEARSALRSALRDPGRLLARKIQHRQALARNSQVDLPGDRLLQQSVEWSKQNLADSVQEARGMRLRITKEGKEFPKPVGTLAKARWLGAGWPDYPWLFGTDGEYTAFASVAAGQFDDIKAHLRALRDASEIVNEGSGKVVHEVISDGSVYFGSNDSAGNTDETSKFPSAVALLWRWTGDNAFRDDLYGFTKRNMEYVVKTLDEDGDGWPSGLGNVERSGMGEEKLDNTVYTIRGLRDLADMARSKGDTKTARWATKHAERMEKAFDQAWWYGGDVDQFADSLDNPDDPANDNTKIQQRHWIGVTPMDAVLVRPGQPNRPLADDAHGHAALNKREENCYTGTYGLYHTGTGPTSAEGGNKGPSCDSAVSTVQSERVVYSLGTGIMAVAEGNFGRLGENQQRRYTTANARVQLDPQVREMPGAMPEVSPSEDFKPNIDRPLYDRAMVLQAWGAYGNLWPVVHQHLGVNPDLGNGRLEIVPQLPDGQHVASGRNIRLGHGAVDVKASSGDSWLRTEVTVKVGAKVLIGHVLPKGASVAGVKLNGKPVDYTIRTTARGNEVVTDARGGHSVLEVTLR